VCGIAGIVTFAPAGPLGPVLERMARELVHRGPDDVGFLTWVPGDTPNAARQPIEPVPAQVGFAHRRLSIIDLTSGGWQPMADDTGRFHVVFNGEIYNYVELRVELRRLGHRFRSESDTEVLLAAFREWGSGCLHHLVGMFAFAVLDIERGVVTVARDPFGIKPLFLCTWPGGLAFASELKPLLNLPHVSRAVHPDALHDYLRFGLTDHREETLLRDVRHLRPGHYLEVSIDRPAGSAAVEYWSPTRQETVEISLADAAAQVRALFLENVRLHLRSDVPVGTALSGGIDSTAIVTGIRHVQDRSVALHSFSFVTKEPDADEEHWIDLASASVGAVARKVLVDPHELVEDVDRLIERQGEPFANTTVYAQARVFELASRSGIKVMLDGQGADELFGGYRAHLSARCVSLLRQGHLAAAIALARRAAALPGGEPWWKVGARMLAGLAPGRGASAMRRWADRRAMPGWLRDEWFERRGAVGSGPAGAQGPDVLMGVLIEALARTSLPALLRYEDRNSMTVSIESRVPFLTPALAEFVLSLPEGYLVDARATSKTVLREAMRGLVPDQILARRDKIGFGTPEGSWLAAVAPWVDSTLADERAGDVAAIDVGAVRRSWAEMRDGKRAYDPRLWRCANLIRWSTVYDVDFPAC
jgi:asparagine synthase (glutamine-hydrolysing)